MEQIFTLLSAVSATPVIDQRTLAAITGISVGKVNALIRSAEQDGYLIAGREGKKSRLTLDRSGTTGCWNRCCCPEVMSS